MSLEVRLPISPRPEWFNRTRLIAASIRRFYPDTIIRCYIGQPGGPTPEAVQAASVALAGFGIEWIGRGEFDAWEDTRSPYLATMNRRFKTPVDGDHVLIMDADVICTAPFDELFEHGAVMGMQAHVPPMAHEEWALLWSLAGLGEPQFDYPYTGGGLMCSVGLKGPFYANSGMVFAPKRLFERLCEPYQRSVATLRRVLSDTYWFDQLALAMAIAESKVPVQSIPLRWNFPNRPAFDAAHPAELDDIRFVHAMQTDIVHRDTEFQSMAAMRKLAQRTDLTGSNEVLRQTVAELLPRLDPPALDKAEDAPWA